MRARELATRDQKPRDRHLLRPKFKTTAREFLSGAHDPALYHTTPKQEEVYSEAPEKRRPLIVEEFIREFPKIWGTLLWGSSQ